MTTKAYFINFEGIDGCGKSTQISYLRQLNQFNLYCTSPGEIEESRQIRSLLLDHNTNFDPKTEIVLHSIARLELVNKIIKPKLQAGYNVVCDRFLDSTIAYQSYGYGLSKNLVTDLHRMLIGDIYPNLTFLLDIDPKISQERTLKRGEKSDRYESKPLDFHYKVRNGFLELAHQNPNEYIVVDALKSPEEIFSIIKETLASL